MKLTKEELCELKGGVAVGVITVDAIDKKGDVINKNSSGGCRCFYNNTGEVTNSNSVVSCSCSCRPIAVSDTVLALPNMDTSNAVLIS